MGSEFKSRWHHQEWSMGLQSTLNCLHAHTNEAHRCLYKQVCGPSWPSLGRCWPMWHHEPQTWHRGTVALRSSSVATRLGRLGCSNRVTRRADVRCVYHVSPSLWQVQLRALLEKLQENGDIQLNQAGRRTVPSATGPGCCVTGGKRLILRSSTDG